MNPNTIIWTDLETGGLRPQQHDITQIAAILDVEGVAVEEINLLLRPDPKRVEQGALDVQKKTMEQVLAHPLSQAEGFAAFEAKLDLWTREAKAAWGGQNAPFDIGFAQALFAAHQKPGCLSKYFSGETVDTRHVAEALRGKGKLMIRNAKLGTICQAVGVALPEDAAHDALNDIRATRAAFYELKRRFLEPAKA